MTQLVLACGANDLLIDASSSFISITSGAGITLTAATTFSVTGAVRLASFGAGLASFDASGNLSSVAGTAFDATGNQSVSGTWAFSNTATFNAATQVNSTLGVTGALTATGALINSGITAQASSIGIPSIAPPAGYSYVIINNTSKQLYRMT